MESNPDKCLLLISIQKKIKMEKGDFKIKKIGHVRNI